MGYPIEGIYRGISSSDSFLPGGEVSAAAFQFKINCNRLDNLEECSINWADDERSLVNIAKQKSNKAGDLVKQFKFGACSICLDRLDELKNKYPTIFSYERAPVYESVDGNEQNPYHGNLLINLSSSDIPKVTKRHISSVLAFITEKVMIREDLDSLIAAL